MAKYSPLRFTSLTMNTKNESKVRSNGFDADNSTVPGVNKCLKAFGDLFSSVDAGVCDPKVQPSLRAAITECTGHFGVWSGNIGAHQEGKSSWVTDLRKPPELRSVFSPFIRI